MKITTTDSIGINKASAGREIYLLAESGTGDNRARLLEIGGGARVIETNGDPCWEGEVGFAEAASAIENT